MDKKLVLVSFFILILSGLFAFSIIGWAQDNDVSGIWQITDIHSFKPVDISQSYSLKRYSNEETLTSAIHSLKATSSGEGESWIFNVLSVAPITDKGSFWSGTDIGYNSLGGKLSAKEVAGGMTCGYLRGCEENDSDVAIGAGYEIVELTKGAVHSDMRLGSNLPPIGSYDFVAFSTGGEGQIKTGVATTTYTADYEQTYEQHITVEEGNSYIRQSLDVW